MVETPTSKISAIRCLDSPASSKRPICAHCSVVNLGRRPPTLPLARAAASPGLSDLVPLILSSKIRAHPAQFSALHYKSVFWSFVDTRT